jgi:ATP/maltotriose-dependent transcriptional regulator MalT
MDLWILAAALFGISAALLIYSFVKKDEEENTTEELEEVSLDILEHISQLKHRVVSLETKLDVEPNEAPLSDRVTDITQKHILTLFTRGASAEEISDTLRISEVSVQHIIDTYISEGIK